METSIPSTTPMRAQLLHLSGPLRGRTVTYDDGSILLGTDAEAQVRYPDVHGVAARHATIRFAERGCAFYLKAEEGDVFVNGQQVREVILEPEDLVEVGQDGPKFRFFVHSAPGRVCKPIRRMMTDARDVGTRSGFRALTASFRRDLIRHSSPQLKVGLPLFLLAVVFVVSYLGGWLGGRTQAKRVNDSAQKRQAHDQEILLNKLTEQGRRDRANLLAQVAQLKAETEAFHKEQSGLVPRKELVTLRAKLSEYGRVVERLVQENLKLRQVLDVYSRGVCLIHGRYAFKMKRKGKLEFLKEANGDPVQLEYMGSGFLVSSEGHILTNRHVAQPWWRNSRVQPLLKRGLIPEFLSLTATFPGHDPVDVDIAGIKVSQENVDVALLMAEVKGVPVLPLHAGPLEKLRGQRVILLGYPTGLGALLARSEPDLVKELLAAADENLGRMIQELANHDAVKPVITQGALNEVTDHRLVYDAETTSGGSGGPVFGTQGDVIGINFAITRDFDGSNFGVPISFGLSLLAGK